MILPTTSLWQADAGGHACALLLPWCKPAMRRVRATPGAGGVVFPVIAPSRYHQQ
jgi:hypothetical protein